MLTRGVNKHRHGVKPTPKSNAACLKVVQPEPNSKPNSTLRAGDVVVGRVISTGPKGSTVELQQGILGYLPHKLAPLHLHGDMYMQSITRQGCAVKQSWPTNGLVRAFQVEKCDYRRPLLSAQHIDYAVLYKRAQQIAELCEDQVLPARITWVHDKGLHACCLGADGFIPLSLLPKKLREICMQQRGHELVGTELPVLIEEVQPERRRMRLNVIAGIAAKRAALQPADLVTGVVSEVHPSYAWVGLSGLDQDGCKAMLHRNDFSVDQSFGTLQDVLCVGESITAMLLKCELNGKRVNLSTAHLELVAGDMLFDRQAVYATAAQQVQIIKAQMAQAAAQYDTSDAPVASVEAENATPAVAKVQAQPQKHQQMQQQQQQQPRSKAKTAQVRVLIPDSLYQLAMASSGYISGVAGCGRPAVVMAAAVWQGPPADWSGAAAGDVLSSIDLEQEWWNSGPLANCATEEREQWQAEQLLAKQALQDTAGNSTADADADALEEGLDSEQLWLQPPMHFEQAP